MKASLVQHAKLVNKNAKPQFLTLHCD